MHRLLLERIFGVVTIGMGLVFLGRFQFLQREAKLHRLPPAGLLGAPLLGLTFGLAWTPCLTPTFGAVYALAASQGTAGRGALLSAVYCLGLGVPFLLVAMGLGWVSNALAVVRRHARLVSQVGGAVLIVMGVLLLSGRVGPLDELPAAGVRRRRHRVGPVDGCRRPPTPSPGRGCCARPAGSGAG